MIKCECGNIATKIEVKGNLITLTADTLRIINAIWNSLDEPCKSEYKKVITKYIGDAFKTDEEMKTEVEEMKKETKEQAKKMFEAMDFLKSLLDSTNGDDELIKELRELKRKEME